jgi:hypothetical protein
MQSHASRIFALALLIFCSVSRAQLTRGFISGIVQDPSGGLIEDVEIRITNRDTGIGRGTRTNAAGVYRLAAVEPGAYSAHFSKVGFESRKISLIEVGATQELVLNADLTVSTLAT